MRTIAMQKKGSYCLPFLLVVLTVLFITPATAHTILPGEYSKLADGIIVHVKRKVLNGVCLVKLQVVTDRIIHVTASPIDSFAVTTSLMVTEKNGARVSWDVKENKDEVIFITPQIRAAVSLITGEIRFMDKAGVTLLEDIPQGGKYFTPVSVEGTPSFVLHQVFETTKNEAFYGLGQHQNGIMNYNGYQVDLCQLNSQVAIPFLVSSKNYGVLWDNYSMTRAGDTREFQPLSALKLYSANGEQGWLTATYTQRSAPHAVVCTRPESVLDYDYLSSQKNFPPEVKLSEVTVKWEGSIEASVTGLHNFLFRYGGYAKLWIDGKLLADRWRQSWNPGTAYLKVPLEKGKRYRILIEWTPDGGESYLSCKWLSPLQGDQQYQFAFHSEAGDQIDYYFVAGNDLDEVIGGYRQLTGRAPIMPKWAMGLWQSRERYKTQDEILNTVSEFRKRKIPLDNIVLDWSYWKEDEWGSQEFDPARFADPAGMIKTLHEKYHTRFMISVWPKFYEGITNYERFNKNGWLYKRNIAKRQRDWIGQGYVSTFYDAYNPQARRAFWDLLKEKLYNKGVDAWWLDATEPDITSNLSPEERKQLMTPTALGPGTKYFNAFALENAKAVYDGQRAANPNERVFILTRSAYGGSQRYAAATWSGDIAARWHDFKIQIAAGINFSLSGLPYWTMDIGGFAVEKRMEEAQGALLEEWRELMTRWYQFGAFCPIFRVHGQFPYREIFNVAPESHLAYKSMLYYDQLRYRLMPYIYSLAGKAYHQNYTIMRGLVMDFPTDTNVYNISDQYLFGPSLMINPVYEKGLTNRNVYTPNGAGWYDWYSGKYVEGGKTIPAGAPLERMPVLVKEGSIIPFGPDIQYTMEKPADPLTLWVYTGKDAQFTLYEDENTNYNYEKGTYANIPVHYNEKEKTLTIGKREGSFPGMLQQRTFRIVWVTKNNPAGIDQAPKVAATLQYKGEKMTVKWK